MLYDTAKNPPPMGTPMEVMFMLVQKIREERRFLRDKAIMLATMGTKESLVAGAELFDSYQETVFFSGKDRKEENQEKKAQDRILDAWLSTKSIGVQPIQIFKMRKG